MFAGLALAPTLIVLALLLKAEKLTEADQAGLAMAVALLACGRRAGHLACCAAEFRQKLSVDLDHLESVFILTTMKVRWSEVERIRWNPTSRWFFLVAAGAWLWVPIDFDGIGDFAELALAALPPTVLGASPGDPAGARGAGRRHPAVGRCARRRAPSPAPTSRRPSGSAAPRR